MIAYQKRVAERADGNPRDLNEYAKLLLTCEPQDLRDPQAALPSAKRAVEMTYGKNVNMLYTLAQACFMTGDTAKAIETQEKAVSLLQPEQSPRRTELEANFAKFRQAAKNETSDQTHAVPANKADHSAPPADRPAGSTGP